MAEKLFEVDYSDFENINKAMKAMPRDAHIALAHALNRTATKTVTYTHDAVKDKYAVKRKGIKETMKISKASRNKLIAVVQSTDRRLKVSHFPYKPVGANRIAKVSVFKGRPVQSSSNPPLFVGRANGSHGKREVFKRTTGGRYKIEYGFTLGIPQMIRNEEVWARVAKQSGEFLQQRFDHEFKQRLIRICNKYSNRW